MGFKGLASLDVGVGLELEGLKGLECVVPSPEALNPKPIGLNHIDVRP